jgi:hypothetical protein
VTAPAPPDTTSRRGLLVGLALGLPVVAYGVRGALVDAARVHPGELTRWVVGLAVIHDALLVPVALGVAWGARRVTPARHWPAVRCGLVASGVLALVSWPFVRGYGHDPGNPSLLPRDYAAGTLAALALVWVLVAAWAASARWRRRLARARRPTDA